MNRTTFNKSVVPGLFSFTEESYKLRWLINRVIFQLNETGRLQHMRQRWLNESYAYPRRASTEGLPFDVQKMPAHYAQGACRESASH